MKIYILDRFGDITGFCAHDATPHSTLICGVFP